MAVNQTFRRLVFAQVLLGIVALCLVEPNLPMLMMVGGLGALSWYVTERGRGPSLSRWMVNVGALAAAAWLVASVFRQPETNVVVATGHFTIWLQLLLLYTRKSNREYGQLLVLSLLSIVAASILGVSMLYGLLLTAYCVLGLVTLVHFHFKITRDYVTEATRAAAPPKTDITPPKAITGRGHAWQLRWLTLGIGLGCVAVAVAVFVVLPRRSAGPMRGLAGAPGLGRKQTGFSQSVRLNRAPANARGGQPVLTVKLTRNGKPVGGDDHPWLLRGAALDHYDAAAHTWTRSALVAGRDRAREVPPHGWSPASGHNQGPAYEAKVTLLRRGFGVLFSVLPISRLRSQNIDAIMFSRMDREVRPLEASNFAAYTIRWPVRPGVIRGPDPPPARTLSPVGRRQHHDHHRWWRQLWRKWRQPRGQRHQQHQRRRRWQRRRREALTHYARGWPSAEQEARLRAYAEKVLDPRNLHRDPADRFDPRDARIATVLARHLRESYKYTLHNPPVSAGVDPLNRFLFKMKRGHCELFASALAALARSVGMQARVVTGYRVSDYNEIGGYYQVRQADAHAWTEINCGPDQGWRTFDATPPDAVQTEDARPHTWLHSVRDLYNLIRYQWTRSVVGYNQQSQRAMMSHLHRSVDAAAKKSGWAGRIVASLGNLRNIWKVNRVAYTLAFIVVVLLVIAVGSLVRLLLLRRRRLTALQLAALPRAGRRTLTRRLRFYLSMLDLLERYGYVRPQWQSPFSFAQELAQANPARFNPVVALTEIFYEIRFGHREMNEDRRQRVNANLSRLERALASRNGRMSTEKSAGKTA